MTQVHGPDRPTARVVCVDPDGRVLLLGWREQTTGRVLFEVPGGGIEADETPWQAARREFVEETGLDPAWVLDVWVPVRRDFLWEGEHYRHVEPFYLAECPLPAPGVRPGGLEPAEVDAYSGHRWVPAADLPTYDFDAPPGPSSPSLSPDLASIPSDVSPTPDADLAPDADLVPAAGPVEAVACLTLRQTFADGNVGGALRVGPTVRRPTGPWTPAVHAVLEHLAAAGLPGVPRVLGTDRAGREILSFLPGRSIDVGAQCATDEVLAQAVAWMRRLHEATADFRPTGTPVWRFGPARLAAGQIVCHNDAGAYNWVVADGRFVGLIDWDMCGPGRPVDDLAFTAWNSVPLFEPMAPRAAARRLRVMARAYGGTVGPEAILERVPGRIREAADAIGRGQRAGDPGMVNLAKVGEPGRMLANLAALEERIPAIAAALDRT